MPSPCGNCILGRDEKANVFQHMLLRNIVSASIFF
jgi:hypothetical protein